MDVSADPGMAAIQNPFLSACTDKTRATVLERSTWQAFDSGSVLLRAGEPAGVVFFVLQGALQMGKTTTRGRRQILCNVGVAGCGGVCVLMLPDRGIADVTGLDAGQVLILPRRDLEELARCDPVLCHAAWRAASDCLAHFATLVESLSFHKVAQRVALMLLEGTEKDGDLIRRTQAEIAAEVGTTREVVARSLAGFQTGGAIRLGRGRITVMDRERLLAES